MSASIPANAWHRGCCHAQGDRQKEASMKTRYAVVAAFCVVLTGTTAAAQQTCGTRDETLRDRDLTVLDRDVNGTPRARERAVTRRSGTGDEDEVISETYVPSIEAGRMALSRRVRRVTTRTSDGSRTVEEVERPNLAAPSDPPRVVRRTVTTVRQSGTGSFTERQMFERDLNGRFELVCTESERSSGN
jgi:hypothetical protein